MVRVAVLLALCLLLSIAAGCGGNAPAGESALNAAPAPQAGTDSAAGLNALASPRDASTGDSAILVGDATSSHFIQTALHPAFDGVGVTREAPDWTYRFAERTEEQIAHYFFVIMHQQGDAVTMGQVGLDLEWQGELPAGNEGFYFGVADHSTNRWRWLGPIRTASDIQDFGPYNLTGDPDMYNRLKVALVNYSSVPVKLRHISFTTIDPELTSGDESLYFVTNADGQFAVNRTTTADLGAVETLHSFDPGVEIDGLSLGLPDGELLLVFNQRVNDGNSEVWQLNPDGSGLALRHSGESDVRFGGFNADSTYEFTIVDDGSQFGKICRHAVSSGEIDLERSLPGAILGTPDWYFLNQSEISLYGTGLDTEGQPMAMQYYYSEQWGSEFYRELVFTSGDLITRDPQFFIWGHGLDPSNNSMSLFSAKTETEATFNIRQNIVCNPPNENNLIFVGDETADLDFPRISDDHKLLAFLRSEPDAETGQLVVQSAFLRTVDETAVVAENVTGASVWFDPTPVVE